jgi:hypothetical protein
LTALGVSYAFDGTFHQTKALLTGQIRGNLRVFFACFVRIVPLMMMNGHIQLFARVHAPLALGLSLLLTRL